MSRRLPRGLRAALVEQRDIASGTSGADGYTVSTFWNSAAALGNFDSCTNDMPIARYACAERGSAGRMAASMARWPPLDWPESPIRSARTPYWLARALSQRMA